MKKIWFWLFLLGLFSLVGTTTYAKDCKEVDFTNGRVCVNITKDSSNTFNLETDIEKGNGTLRCGILLSNNTYKEIAGCNDDFFVSNIKEQIVKLYIKLGSEYPSDWEGKPNNRTERLFPQWTYDFDDEEWTDGVSNNDDNTSDNGDVDNFSVTTDDTTPSINQRVDLKIKARDNDNSTVTDYTNAVDFIVYYRSSSSSSWTKTTSSSYFEIDSDYDDGYDFRSSDKGYVTLTDAIRFKKDYEYKVEVVDQDDDNVVGNETFDVGGNGTTNNGDVDNFYVTTDDTTPSINQRIDLKIKARDNDNSTVTDYTNAVDFIVYYRSSSSSSWTKTTSSSYFEIDSDYDDGYDFRSSDNGYVTLTDAIRFKKEYEYKVEVVDQDDDNIVGNETFDVGGNDTTNNGDVDNFYVTTDDTTPSINQRVDLKIKARDNSNYTVTDYTNAVDFIVYYRSSSSSSWTKTTSSSYFEIDSDYDDGYDFRSSDNGYVTLTDAIRFKKDYEYKVEVVDQDDDNIVGNETFDVGGNGTNNGDIDNFLVTTDDTTPSINQRVDLKIKARDNSNITVTDYTNAVDFIVYYRNSSSSSWTKTTSSTYFEFNSDYKYGYDFTSSNKGYVVLTDAIRFKKNIEYKVEVVDQDDEWTAGNETFDVGGNGSTNNEDIDNFDVSTDDTTPSINQRVDLNIKARDGNNNTLSSYRGTVEFVVYYRSSSSSSWKETTSSSYYEIRSSYVNGYSFTSYDYGVINIYDVITFKKDYEYKVEVVDQDDNSILGYETFDVNGNGSTNSSNVNDFYVTTDDTTPSIDQRVDLSIKARDGNGNTVSSYRSAVDFEIYYRKTSSSSRIKTSSSTYYEMASSYNINGYTFTYYDYGDVILYDAIRFKKDYEYKVEVIDQDNGDIIGYKTFDVGGNSSSSTDGFTSSEITQIQNTYDVRDTYIQSIKNTSSSLRYNQTRITMSNDLKAEMKKIINDSSSKKYNNYEEFQTAFNTRYSYTSRNK